jgi:uncharacterized protein HemY
VLKEILDQAAERIGKELGTQPGAEAELLDVIGGAYNSIGDYGKAEKMLRASINAARKQYGIESARSCARKTTSLPRC